LVLFCHETPSSEQFVVASTEIVYLRRLSHGEVKCIERTNSTTFKFARSKLNFGRQPLMKPRPIDDRLGVREPMLVWYVIDFVTVQRII